MIKFVKPVIAGIVIGALVGAGLLWMEFGGVEEGFVNYKITAPADYVPDNPPPQ